MKLYTFPASPNSLRITAVAYQVRLPLELVPVDLTKREHMTPEFTQLNPNNKIPVLVDGDFVLWESGAIMHYLAELKPRSKLVPREREARMRMHQWMYWNATSLGAAAQFLVFEHLVKGLLHLGEPDPNEIRRGEEGMHRFCKVLNEHLRGRDFLVGDGLTLADHHVASTFVHAEAGRYPLSGYDEVRRWSGQMLTSRPWKKALKDLR